MSQLVPIKSVAIIFSALLLESGLAGAAGPPFQSPTVTIDLGTYGYEEPHDGLIKTVFGDLLSHVTVIDNDLAVVYHTVPDHMERTDSTGTLLAYFIDLSSGKLVRKQEWHTLPRNDVAETIDSEGRILALSQKRYAVLASKTFYLYGNDGSLLMQRDLRFGLWSVQAIDNGRVLFFRHYLKSSPTSYIWQDSKTLEKIREFDDTDDYRSQTVLTGYNQLLLYARNDGIHGLTLEGADHILCSDEVCRESGVSAPVNSGLVLASRFGLGILSPGVGVTWFRRISPDKGIDRVTAGGVETSLDGKTLAARITRGKKNRSFDDVEVEMPWEIFVYGSEGQRLSVLPGDDTAFGLSPDGKTVVTFDSRFLRVFAVP